MKMLPQFLNYMAQTSHKLMLSSRYGQDQPRNSDYRILNYIWAEGPLDCNKDLTGWERYLTNNTLPKYLQTRFQNTREDVGTGHFSSCLNISRIFRTSWKETVFCTNLQTNKNLIMGNLQKIFCLVEFSEKKKSVHNT